MNVVKKISFIFCIIFSLIVMSTPIRADEEMTTSKYESVNTTYEYYQNKLDLLYSYYTNGMYTEKEYKAELKTIKKERDDKIKKLIKKEEEFELENNSTNKNNEGNKNNTEEENVDNSSADIIYVKDGNGKVIYDYNKVDFSKMKNKRTFHFDCEFNEGTSASSDLSITIDLSASNLTYNTTVVLNKANNFTASADVPNDVYFIEYTYTGNDHVNIDSSYMSAQTNPTITAYVLGTNKVLTNGEDEKEIVTTKKNEEKTINIDKKTVTTIIVIMVIVVIIVTGIIVILKKKHQYNI